MKFWATVFWEGIRRRKKFKNSNYYILSHWINRHI
jgi:hypothetical protein